MIIGQLLFKQCMIGQWPANRKLYHLRGISADASDVAESLAFGHFA